MLYKVESNVDSLSSIQVEINRANTKRIGEGKELWRKPIGYLIS